MREESANSPRYHDAESGLYHYRARAYSPDLGRFLQQDPAGMVDGPNLYAYCGNNPVNKRDPTGMKIEMDERKFSDCLSENIEDIGMNLLSCLLTVVTAKAVLFYATTIFGSAASAKFTMGLTVPIAAVAVTGWVWLLVKCFETSPAAYDAWRDVLKCGWDAISSPPPSAGPTYPVGSGGPLMINFANPFGQNQLAGPLVTNSVYNSYYNPKAGWWMI